MITTREQHDVLKSIYEKLTDCDIYCPASRAHPTAINLTVAEQSELIALLNCAFDDCNLPFDEDDEREDK